MKTVFGALVGALLVIGLIYANLPAAVNNNIYTGYGAYYDDNYSSSSVVSVSSSATSTLSAQMNCAERIITNNGTGTVYIAYSTSTTQAVTAYGLPLYKNETLIEDRWFGVMYLRTEAGSATSDVRVVIIKGKMGF